MWREILVMQLIRTMVDLEVGDCEGRMVGWMGGWTEWLKGLVRTKATQSGGRKRVAAASCEQGEKGGSQGFRFLALAPDSAMVPVPGYILRAQSSWGRRGRWGWAVGSWMFWLIEINNCAIPHPVTQPHPANGYPRPSCIVASVRVKASVLHSRQRPFHLPYLIHTV